MNPHRKKKKTDGKDSASPFESKLIFSYNGERSVLKIRQAGNNSSGRQKR